jgi:tetratricopeptide (TPR) repeat protein
MRRFITRLGGKVVLLVIAICVCSQSKGDSPDARALIEQGNAAVAQRHIRDAIALFQRAVDLDPSSAKAHEQLGATVAKEVIAGNIRPSADSDLVERAQDHLQRAIELAPYAVRPLIALAELDAALAERSNENDGRSDRYKNAQELLKKAVALKPGNEELYLELAKLERDEFSPVIQQAKARFKQPGPLPDAQLRQSLQQQYGDLIEDAISNARKASELNASSLPPLLLMSRLLKERALLRDTADQYASDMHSAEDWYRQFLVNGGHTGSEGNGTSR